MEIVAGHVVPHFHALVLNDGEHPVDNVGQCGERVVIESGNLSLLRYPQDLVSVVIIGRDPDVAA